MGSQVEALCPLAVTEAVPQAMEAWVAVLVLQMVGTHRDWAVFLEVFHSSS